MSKYTTGEIAKLCNVSVRTVQYYDDRGLLSPSELTEGGRRLYTDKDVSQLKIICYLRDLDFSIKQIEMLLKEQNSNKVLNCLLDEQINTLTCEVKEKQAQLDTLEQIKSFVKKEDFSLNSIGDVVTMMKNKNKLKKVYATTFAIGLPLSLYQIFSIVFWIVTGTWWPFVVWAGIAIPYGIIISKYYWNNVAYICPECNHVFKPKFKEGFFANHTPKTRKLTCPHCNVKSFCIETSVDELNK
ncbi:MAG: MerR family transcriptional regulator [Clostridia bacterium]|nr:MerR family transcriptional regulator [Clostridia bacterium]